MKRSQYNWKQIQSYYDSGNSLNEVRKKFGMSYRTFELARKRGQFKTRTKKQAALIAKARGRNQPNYKYDWKLIQKFYDQGNSWRDVQRRFGMTHRTIQKAIRSGRFKTRSHLDAMQLYIERHGVSGGSMSLEARKRLSKRQSEHNSGGKSKWYEVAGKKVQGTWERDLALLFERQGVQWERCKSWSYYIDGKKKSYTPDFYLPEYGIYLEVKGYWWGADKEKMEAVKFQYPYRKLLILDKKEW